MSKEEIGDYEYVPSSSVAVIFRQLKQMDPVMAFELSLATSSQNKLLNSDSSDSMQSICYRQRKGKSHVEHHFCLDPVLMVVMRMISDMSKCIHVLRAEENEEYVKHFMEVCGEYWDRSRKVNVRKLFMLAIVLTEGLDVENVDNKDLVDDILEKIDDNGDFYDGRKRRAKTKRGNPDKKRMKRGPSFQPRVKLVRQFDYSDDDDIALTPVRKNTGQECRNRPSPQSKRPHKTPNPNNSQLELPQPDSSASSSYSCDAERGRSKKVSAQDEGSGTSSNIEIKRVATNAVPARFSVQQKTAAMSVQPQPSQKRTVVQNKPLASSGTVSLRANDVAPSKVPHCVSFPPFITLFRQKANKFASMEEKKCIEPQEEQRNEEEL